VRRRPARILVALLGLAAIALVAVEFGMGAIGFGRADLANPCTTRPHLSEGGFFGAIDAAVQRFALSGLNGAACSLHTSREELVLSFAPSLKTKKVHWTKATIRKALRGGLDRAARDTVSGAPAWVANALAFVFREAIADPIAFFLGEVAT
jgi:hypothetical protein